MVGIIIDPQLPHTVGRLSNEVGELSFGTETSTKGRRSVGNSGLGHIIKCRGRKVVARPASIRHKRHVRGGRRSQHDPQIAHVGVRDVHGYNDMSDSGDVGHGDIRRGPVVVGDGRRRRSVVGVLRCCPQNGIRRDVVDARHARVAGCQQIHWRQPADRAEEVETSACEDFSGQRREHVDAHQERRLDPGRRERPVQRKQERSGARDGRRSHRGAVLVAIAPSGNGAPDE